MKPTVMIVSMVLLVAASLAAGYWWGSGRQRADVPMAVEGKAVPAVAAAAPAAAPASAAKPKILYYRNPMGLSLIHISEPTRPY